jgi:SpoVK/Ycf46/Vps4 family AAA+-type ATPase
MRAANELADKLARKVYRVDLRPFISRFIGETEKNLDRIFGTVEPTHTLLYFDEADTLFGKNAGGAASLDRSAQWWVPYLNKRVKEFQGPVLFATNHHSRTTKIARQLKPVITHISPS